MHSQESTDESQGPPGCLPRSRPRARSCLRLLSRPKKVLLFPEEGWATGRATAHLLLLPPKWVSAYWWAPSSLQVMEVVGGRRGPRVRARIAEADTSSSLRLVGSFKRRPGDPDPDFQLALTTNLSREERRRGYCMTGTLHRGDRATGLFAETHYAAVVDYLQTPL